MVLMFSLWRHVRVLPAHSHVLLLSHTEVTSLLSERMWFCMRRVLRLQLDCEDHYMHLWYLHLQSGQHGRPGFGSLGVTALMGMLKSSVPKIRTSTMSKPAPCTTVGRLFDLVDEERVACNRAKAKHE